MSTVETFDIYLENISAKATNEIDVLNFLLAKNERLTFTKDTTLSETHNLLTNRESAHANKGSKSGLVAEAGGGSTSSEFAYLKKQVQHLRASIHFKWMKRGFSSTHGWGFSEGHDSNVYLRKVMGHITTVN